LARQVRGLGQREETEIGEVSIRPLLMVVQAALTAGSMLLAAQDRAQPTADEAVEGREGKTMGVLEVAEPGGVPTARRAPR